MILLPEVPLARDAVNGLAEYQAGVDAEASYQDRVAAGKRLFSARNKRGNAIFDAVKRALDQMCSGARRCAYCEDSMADEVEHVRPKDLYPDRVFSWTNYIYACGPCNGPKGSAFAVFPAGNEVPVEVARKRGAAVVPPIAGDDVLIDPRREDATNLLVLDLRDTYWFAPRAKAGTREHQRAIYTIKVLHLNDRDALPRSRRAAYVDYVNYLRRYRADRDSGVSAAALSTLRDGITTRQHPTVWKEMQRQHAQIPELTPLFGGVPEALTW